MFFRVCTTTSRSIGGALGSFCMRCSSDRVPSRVVMKMSCSGLFATKFHGIRTIYPKRRSNVFSLCWRRMSAYVWARLERARVMLSIIHFLPRLIGKDLSDASWNLRSSLKWWVIHVQCSSKPNQLRFLFVASSTRHSILWQSIHTRESSPHPHW